MPVAGITVRESRRGDGEHVARIHRESGRLYRELAPERFRQPDEDGLAAFCEPEPRRDDLLQLVAEVDGVVAGFLEARLMPPLDSARYQSDPDLGLARLSIGAVETAEEFRRLGVATALVAAAEEWGRRRGARVAFCDTWIDSPLSMPFWEERMGYARRAVIFRKPL
jgi:ribosomal protein S18 acetylase RimI-like enzyme